MLNISNRDFRADQLTLSGPDGLRVRVKRAHNYIYANDALKQHGRVFDELAKVILAKLVHERADEGRTFEASEGEKSEVDRLGPESSYVRWIDGLYRSALEGTERAEPIQLRPHVLMRVVDEFSDLRLLGTDAKGAAFQAIVGPQMRTEKGQFFTPEPAKRLLSGVLNVRPDETVLDPACGSGGLLLATPSGRRVGIEVDGALARMARLGLMLNGADRFEIHGTDSLAPWETLTGTLPSHLHQNRVDVVMTNPPFGSRARVTDVSVLRDLPHIGGKRGSAVPELLFLERILQWLRPGGRAGVVLPLGVLANSSAAEVRRFLRSQATVFATITLPPETFRPAENGVQAALLFFVKHGGDRPISTRSFRAIVRKVGYDHRERPIFRRDRDGSSHLDEDVTAVLGAWQKANEVNQWT